MTFEIRKAGPSDALALALVGQATFLQSYSDFLPAEDVIAHCVHEHGEDRYSEWLAKPDYWLFLAEHSGGRAPIGYIMLCPPDLPVETGPGDMELKRIYLLHRYHGGGGGGLLMRTAVEAAREAKARRLLLGVYGQNHAALGFYARQGFTQVGVRKFQVGENIYDDLVLAKEI
jgi:ribosomal protein S18 acetylase RimI-like enzyme